MVLNSIAFFFFYLFWTFSELKNTMIFCTNLRIIAHFALLLSPWKNIHIVQVVKSCVEHLIIHKGLINDKKTKQRKGDDVWTLDQISELT